MPKLFHIDPDTRTQSLECAQHDALSVDGKRSDERPGAGGTAGFYPAF
jgi:hypothetical protein